MKLIHVASLRNRNNHPRELKTILIDLSNIIASLHKISRLLLLLLLLTSINRWSSRNLQLKVDFEPPTRDIPKWHRVLGAVCTILDNQLRRSNVGWSISPIIRFLLTHISPVETDDISTSDKM